LKASIAVLKAVGMYGNGTMNTIGEQDPEVILRQQAAAQVDRSPKCSMAALLTRAI
jgi:hypothetical protein